MQPSFAYLQSFGGSYGLADRDHMPYQDLGGVITATPRTIWPILQSPR